MTKTIGRCPMYGDVVELVDRISEMPDGAQVVDSNETYVRYEYQGLVFVRKRPVPHKYNFANVLKSNGGDRV